MICIVYKDPVVGASLYCFAAAAYNCWLLASKDRQKVLGVDICATIVLYKERMMGLQQGDNMHHAFLNDTAFACSMLVNGNILYKNLRNANGTTSQHIQRKTLVAQLTYNGDTVVYVRAVRSIEDLVWMGIVGTSGNIIRHHGDNVVFRNTTTSQHLICLQGAGNSFCSLLKPSPSTTGAHVDTAYVTDVSLVAIVAPATRSSYQQSPYFACNDCHGTDCMAL